MPVGEVKSLLFADGITVDPPTSGAAATFSSLAPTTTKGDLIVHDGSANARLPVGANGAVLTADSTQTAGVKWGTALTNPMTTQGDIIVAGASGLAQRLAAVTNNRVVRGNGTDVVSGQIDNTGFFTTGALGTNAAPGVRYGVSYIQSQTQTGLANATDTNIGSSTLSLAAGTYLVQMTARPRVTTSVAPTTIIANLLLTDDLNNSLTSSGTGVPIAVTNDYRACIAHAAEIVLASTTTVKLRGNITVSGGTVTSRDIQNASAIFTRIS